MPDDFLNFLLGQLADWGYYIVFAMAFLETSAFVGLLVPGETVVVIAGLAAATGSLRLDAVIGVASTGAVLGDTVGYFIGCHFGEAFFARYGRYLFFKPRYLRQSQRFFAAHGGKTVFFGRFVGYLRAFAPVVAGISRMPYHWFLLANVSGAIAWATAFTLIGYFVGGNWQTVERYLGRAGTVAFGLAVIGALAYLQVSRDRRQARKARQENEA